MKMPLPNPVRRGLIKLGVDIKDARRRRGIPVRLMAERASISRATLLKIEQGYPGVSMGHYATVLFVLGMMRRISDLADIKFDEFGLMLDEERLPQRIRTKKYNDENE